MCTKRLICKPFLKNSCTRDNCKFAHSIEEQIIDDERKSSFDEIMKNIPLNYNDYVNLLQLTKICEKCSEKKCIGGINCTYGAINYDNLICKKDFFCGKCKENTILIKNNIYINREIRKCPNGVHLTELGMIPYNNINVHKKLLLLLSSEQEDDSDNICLE